MNEASSRSHAIVQLSLHEPLAPDQAVAAQAAAHVCGEVFLFLFLFCLG